MKNYDGTTISTEKNSLLVHQNSLAVLPARTSGIKQEEWAKGMRI
jgi:hypothetical protein